MAEARGAGRARPRGASKIKVHGTTTQSKHPMMSKPSPQNTVLPKLKLATISNNHNDQASQPAPFSPRVREIPLVLPVAPHPPSTTITARPAASLGRPVPPSLSPSAPSDLVRRDELAAKTAWSTPRNSVPEIPETSEPPSISPSSSALDTFFRVDGSSVPTPTRLLAVEETLIAAEQLYEIDWTKLQADSDKFLEISSTATQHLDGIQAELPVLMSTTDLTRAALSDLSKDVESLHGHCDAEKVKMLAAFEHTLTQHNDESAALEVARAAEKRVLQETHVNEVESLKAHFQRQIHEIEERSAEIETKCLQEIDLLKRTMASELQRQSENSKAAQEELERRYQNELHELRTRSNAELVELRDSSKAAYHELLTSSQREIGNLKSASAKEIERLLEVSACTLEEITEQLTTELSEAKEDATKTISALQDNHAIQVAQLECARADALAQLKRRHDEEYRALRDERDRQVDSLEQALKAAKATHCSQVEELTARFTAQLSATTATLTGENNILVQCHKREVINLRSKHTNDVNDIMASFESQLATLKHNHMEQMNALKIEMSSSREALMQEHESQLRNAEGEAAREKDRLVLRYESDLDFLRRSTADQVEMITAERESAIQQLREAHAARILTLETTMRENDKRQSEAIAQLEEDLEEKKARILALENVEVTLREENAALVEQGKETTSRWSMRQEELVAAISRLEEERAARDDAVETLKRDLRRSEDGNHTKSNSLLELTFVVKSRDEEIEKLHAALLNTIQNVNSKTEILELTAETLSTKTKELEDTRNALRMESGRLSRVEEDVQVKTGMLEDSELKIENMRLQLENLRLEMKRLQMDMRLQHEHSAGEMELKQGEIRRLHAAQNELKQKNDIQQETIVRLEGSLAAAQRQSDELHRRMELLKVETGQHLEDARKLGDELLDKEKQNAAVTKEAQDLHNEKLKLQIRFNNSQTIVQTQREKLEHGAMVVEDIHCQYQRRMEMTAAEKDARLRHERHLLLLELGNLKDALRRYEEIEIKLNDSQALCEARQVQIHTLVSEKTQLESRIKALEGDSAQLEIEKATVIVGLKNQIDQLEQDLKNRSQCVQELEGLVAQARQELATRDAEVATVSNVASSLNRLIQEKDVEVATLQQRLDDALQEKVNATQEIAVLRNELAQIEHSCVEKDEEIDTLEKAFQSESVAHLRDVKDSEDQLDAMEKHHSEVVRRLEEALEIATNEKVVEAQALQETTLQIQYLVEALKSTAEAHHAVRQNLEQVQTEKALWEQEVNLQVQYLVERLKHEGEALAKAIQELQDGTARLRDQEREAEEKLAVSVTLAVEVHRVEIKALKDELKTLSAAHSAHLQQLEETKTQELDQLRSEMTTVSQKALIVAQQGFHEEIAAIRAEHARLMAEASEASRVQQIDIEARLAAAIAESEDLTRKYEESGSRCLTLAQREVELQEKIAEIERSLTETQEVVRVRKATVESVRKEMALLMEMQKQASVIGEDGSPNGANSGGSMEHMFQLLRQQLETFVNEEFQVEFPQVEINNQEDLLVYLKDHMRMRYCLSTIGSPYLLSSQVVCAALNTLQQIARATVGDTELSIERLPIVEKSVKDHAQDLTVLIRQLQQYLDAGEAPDIITVLEEYVPAFELLKELPRSEDGTSVHASRVTALRAVIADHRAMKASIDSLLTKARTAFDVQSLDDILSLIDEAAFLRRQILARCNWTIIPEEVSLEPTTNLLLTSELQVLLNDRQLLLSELASTLKWEDHNPSSPPLNRSVLIVDAVRELMRVFHAFDALTSSRHRDDLAETSTAERAQAIVAFAEELRMITQFAHNILDEEVDATTIGAADNSNSSSTSSLLSVPIVLTRTPTPTNALEANAVDSISQSASATMLPRLENDVDLMSPDNAFETNLLLSGDALAPTENSAHIRPSLPGALSESLLDISLVMNDHHRILSEAAHWVGKAHSMSPRNKQNNGTGSSLDFVAELSQLMRDHCMLLSLARKLFKLQDPRQDLPSVLQCLAVLSRLSGRLGFFDLSMRVSDSSESLQSTADSESKQHDKLKASLSVFASMEAIARHLQDYDGFVGRMIPTHFDREGSTDTIDNIDILSGAIDERLAMIELLRVSLGLRSVVDELPAFVTSIQHLVAESTTQRDDHEDDKGSLSADALLEAITDAFRDRKALAAMLERMRETLPFSSSAESSEELLEQLNETLSQCDTLIQEKNRAWTIVETLTEQLADMDKQHAAEEKALGELNDDTNAGLSRVERIAELVQQLQTLREENRLMATSIAAEIPLLHDDWPQDESYDESDQLNGRVAAVRALLEAKEKLAESKKALKVKLEDTKSEYESKLLEADAKLRVVTIESESKLGEAEAKLHDTETAFKAKFHNAEGEFEAKLQEYDSALEAKLRERESVLETRLREAESTHETKLRETENALGMRLREIETGLRAKLQAAEDQLVSDRRQQNNAIEAERQFVLDRGIEWAEDEPRMCIYERLIGICNAYKGREQQLRHELTEEAAFLLGHGMTMATAEKEVHMSRMAVLKTLLEGQRVLIDEKMEREIVDRQDLARLEAEGIDVPDREAMVTRLIELSKQVKSLTHEKTAQLTRQKDICDQELVFLYNHGISNIELSPSDSRIVIYEAFLQRIEAVKQSLVAWEGSPHGDALGCRQADALREIDRQNLEFEYADNTAKAVSAALEKQAQQLDFRRAALAAGDAASSSLAVPIAPSNTHETVEAFTKRDNTVVSMIYRLIRLTTDILNTSAFSSSTTTTGGEIPVDLTQAVMTCVKELKALKEYLLQTLEEITKDSGAFVLAQPPLVLTRESVTDRDAAIDFALLLHRDFAAHVNKTLQDKCDVVNSTIQKLSESLAMHAGDFSDVEAKCMAMDMALAKQVAKTASLEAKCSTQEEFMQRFIDERKRIEGALTAALAAAKQERTELQAKMEALEAEKCEAVALIHANGYGAATPSAVSTPRTPMSSHGRMYTAVVPTRPDKPRELTSSRLKTGMMAATGAVHKERFVSDLEKETGQRRTTTGISARRANEWKRHELLTSSTQLEQQFRAMNESPNILSLSLESPVAPKSSSLADQELWYQGVRMLQHVSFFVSVFFVPKQRTFRVEVFNSESEQQQTIYVTLEEMQDFLHESKRANKIGLTLDDPARHSEIADILFERVKILGGDSSNLLIAFQ